MGFKPDIVHEANNAHSILQLVEAGLGVSILPYSLKQQYGYLKVSVIELENIPVSTEVVLAYKQSNKMQCLNGLLNITIEENEKAGLAHLGTIKARS